LKIIKRAVLVLIAIVGSTYGMADEQNNDYYHGTVSGYDFNEYHLQLIKGDWLTAVLKSPKLEVIIFTPISKNLTHGEPFEIKKSGEYTLRVLMPRVFARRNLQLDYQLSLTIDR
jgi:hypothetical protein